MVQGITKQLRCWRFPAGLPPGRAGSPQPFPHSGRVPAQTVMWGLLCPALHPSYSSCSPKSRLGSAGAGLSSLLLRCCFFITSKFCWGLCKHFPENTKGRAKGGGAWMCFF